MAVIARPIDVRRAVLGRLLASGAPVTIAALVDEMNRVFGVDAASPKRIADVLRYQVRLGRVRRVDRGVYQVVPGALPKATAWRCLNWRVERDYQDERRRPRGLTAGAGAPVGFTSFRIDVRFGTT